MAFRVGQKVERIGGMTMHPIVLPPMHTPVTVSNSYLTPDGEELIEIAEFPSPETDGAFAGFRAKFYRPIVERKTDTGMAVLENIRRDVTNKILRPIFEDEQA